jgi:decaprenylphospho-beta-D-erythro-pentofuranosid-2-ulose 2-reductase
VKDALGEPQSVLVLGATSDIAQALIRRLVRRRTRTVILAGRRPTELDGFATELRTLGATTVETVAFDARDTGGHAALLDRIFERHVDVDVVVLAFGILGSQAAFDLDPAAAVDAAITNYVGAVSAGLLVAQHFREQGHGLLVVLSSVAGERIRKANFVYGSTKAGLDGFAQGLSEALAGTGARVLIVRPGFVATKMTAGLDEAPFATTADAVAFDVVAAMTRRAEVVYSPPKLRWVFMVLRHLPRPLWRKLAR